MNIFTSHPCALTSHPHILTSYANELTSHTHALTSQPYALTFYTLTSHPHILTSHPYALTSHPHALTSYTHISPLCTHILHTHISPSCMPAPFPHHYTEPTSNGLLISTPSLNGSFSGFCNTIPPRFLLPSLGNCSQYHLIMQLSVLNQNGCCSLAFFLCCLSSMVHVCWDNTSHDINCLYTSNF